MELETFIQETLVAICNGIKSAKQKVNTENTVIAPSHIEGAFIAKKPREINFEVSVVVNNENKLQVDGGAGGKVNVGIGKANASLNAGAEKSSHQTSVNKISFSVPYVAEGIR